MGSLFPSVLVWFRLTKTPSHAPLTLKTTEEEPRGWMVGQKREFLRQNGHGRKLKDNDDETER